MSNKKNALNKVKALSFSRNKSQKVAMFQFNWKKLPWHQSWATNNIWIT
jgi:hypothetical protein